MDSELRVAQPTPKLSAMVMLDTCRDVQGLRFTTIMPCPEDASRFESLALATLEEPSGAMPGAMRACLQGPGVRIPVSLTFVPFRDLEGVDQLLVGLSEDVGQSIAELQSAHGHSIHGNDRPSRLTDSQELPPASPRHSKMPARLAMKAPVELEANARLHQSGEPDLAVPTLEVREQRLLRALELWSAAVESPQCCACHAKVAEAQTELASLNARCCTSRVTQGAEAQSQDDCCFTEAGNGSGEASDANCRDKSASTKTAALVQL